MELFKGLTMLIICIMSPEYARRLGVSTIGTVGILVKAKRSGIIPSLKTLLSELEANGFYLNDVLKEEALRLAGE